MSSNIPARESRVAYRRRRKQAPTADEWNNEHPIGTEVVFWPGVRTGDGRLSRTRSSAWDIGYDEAFVLVEGHPGGISLTHVEPVVHVPALQPQELKA